jgi:hypothetical protein
MAKLKKLTYYWAMITPLVLTPWYKNFAKSFFNGLVAVPQAMLDSAMLDHYSARLSWSNIRILWTYKLLEFLFKFKEYA